MRTGIGLVFTLGFAFLPISKWENEFANVVHLTVYEVIWWAAIAAVLLYVTFVERRPLSTTGVQRLSLRDATIGFGAGIVTIAGLAFIYFVIFPALHLNEENQMNTLLATPLWWRIVSVVRAGVGEELLYRGYAIERLEELSGSRAVAGIVSCALFTVAHVGPWGWAHLLIAGFGGVMLTVLYLWRRNLWVNIIAHALVDGVAVLAG